MPTWFSQWINILILLMCNMAFLQFFGRKTWINVILLPSVKKKLGNKGKNANHKNQLVFFSQFQTIKRYAWFWSLYGQYSARQLISLFPQFPSFWLELKVSASGKSPFDQLLNYITQFYFNLALSKSLRNRILVYSTTEASLVLRNTPSHLWQSDTTKFMIYIIL